MNKLNLGCGNDIKEGFINVDIYENKGVDMTFDLNKFPYPFKDNEFDYIILSDIMEHLDDSAKVIEEVYRITRANGIIKVKVPHYSSADTWRDLTHRRGFSYQSFCYYDVNNPFVLGSLELQKRKIKFKVKCKFMFGKMHRMMGLQKLLNIESLFIREFYEGNLAYIFPTKSIVFTLEVIK